ncbi:MAG TPA: PKD domain-containing protein, partial [Thermoplasmatales archaeon]|nr:PKD domain-containing protein [Thermoplasmatales archaeon]
GDIIKIRAGTYVENIKIVDKSLHLIGEDNPTIRGKSDGYIIWMINASNSTLSGLTVEESKGREFSCIRIEESNNVSISDCTVERSSGADGIMLIDCRYLTISGCKIRYNNQGNGISLMLSSNNRIVGNIISDNQNGITLYGSSENEIIGNTIKGNKGEYGIGIRVVSSSSGNIISENIFEDNDQNAEDKCSNFWYDPIEKKGNYWDDYQGKDSNHDGIGDTPYQIPGGDNQDIYVLGFFAQEEPSQPKNQKPVADAGGEYHGMVNSSITFDASQSYDPDGEIVEYIWDFGDGSIGKGKVVTHSYSSPGDYTVTLTVRDERGAEDDDVTTAHISEYVENKEPVAIIELKDYAIVGEILEFNASKSYDPDGEIVNYVWKFGDGKVAYGKVVEHAYSESGTYNVTLEVVDDLGYTNSTKKSITVLPEGGEIKADFSVETNLLFVGSDIVFNASKSSGSIISYIWSFGDGENITTSLPICNHTYLKPGIYQVNLTVVGANGEKDTKSITIVIEGAWKKDTPGFELIFIILSIAIFYMVRRR